MLRNKAMIQAIRVAFGIGGIHDEDEARDIGGMRNVTPKITKLDAPINPFAKLEVAKEQIQEEPSAGFDADAIEPELL
jgi:hypothetical protein